MVDNSTGYSIIKNNVYKLYIFRWASLKEKLPSPYTKIRVLVLNIQLPIKVRERAERMVYFI